MNHHPAHAFPASRRAAFTLIELLTVIAIIGILAAIIIPVVGKVRQTAKTAQGVANVRQIASGLLLYATSNRDQLPYAYEASGPSTDYTIRLSGFLNKRTEVYSATNLRSPIFLDPLAALDGGAVHFSVPPVLMPNKVANASPARLGSIRRPSELVLVMDGAQDPSNGSARVSASAVAGITQRYASGGDVSASVPPGPNADTSSGLSHIRWRARDDKAAKFGFCDGHVSILAIGELKNRHIWAD